MKNRESVMKISKRLKREKRWIFRNQKRKLFKNYIRNRFIEIRFRSEHMLSWILLWLRRKLKHTSKTMSNSVKEQECLIRWTTCQKISFLVRKTQVEMMKQILRYRNSRAFRITKIAAMCLKAMNLQ
jgi:hypothetical protein